MKEKSLSEKSQENHLGNGCYGDNYFYEEDVKEAVKKLKDIIQNLYYRGYCSPLYLNEEIDKIFGEELGE